MVEPTIYKRLMKLLKKSVGPILFSPRSPRDEKQAKILQDFFNYQWDCHLLDLKLKMLYGTTDPATIKGFKMSPNIKIQDTKGQ